MSRDASTLAVGMVIYLVDENRRVYPAGHDRISASPIWREHWRPVEITGETSRSWLIGPTFRGRDQVKIPRRGPLPWHIATDAADIDRRAWVNDHAHRIAEDVRRSKDFDRLRAVARIIGYTWNDAGEPGEKGSPE